MRVYTNAGLFISVNESKCMRTVLIKGLTGYGKNILALIKTFNNRIAKAAAKGS
jgi:hypothetical protein